MSAEEVMDIVETLKAKCGCNHVALPIHSIDGIVCHGILSISRVNEGPYGPDVTPEFKKVVELEIAARYKNDSLYVKRFPSDAKHQDVVDFIKTLSELKYCQTTSRFHHDANEWHSYKEKKFIHDLFSDLGTDNMRLDFDDCPVCLESTYTKLPCGHHLCLKCESKMKECKCPQCREKYCRFPCCDDSDEEVY